MAERKPFARDVIVRRGAHLVGYVSSPRRGIYWAYSSFPGVPPKKFGVKGDAVAHLEAASLLWDPKTPAGLRRQANVNPAAKAKRRKQYQFRVKVKVPRRQNMAQLFWSSSDASALSYCSGLLIHQLPKGARAVSCQRTGRTRYKTTGKKA